MSLKDVREWHRRYKFKTRGVLLSRTVSLRYDYYLLLLQILARLQAEVEDRLSLSEVLAYALDVTAEVLGVKHEADGGS